MGIGKVLAIGLLAAVVHLSAPTGSKAVTANGAVVAVDGLDITIRVETMGPFAPAVGYSVDIMDTSRHDVTFDIGDWRITEVHGNIVKAQAVNAIGVNPPKVGMSAAIHIPDGPVHTAVAPSKKSDAASFMDGKVVMTQGNDITVRMNSGSGSVRTSDRVEVSFSVGGETIPVGEWQVSGIRDDGMVEAKPLEINGAPNIDMDARIFPSGDALDLETNHKQAWAYLNGDGVSQDDIMAATLFLKGCNGGYLHNCISLAYLHEKGRGVPLDEVRAFELYTRACDGGQSEGCRYVGDMLYDGRGVTKDMARATAAYIRSCGGGWSMGCRTAGYMYQNGHGVTQDYGRAVEYFERACSGGVPMACTDMGLLLAQGQGVQKDYNRALTNFQRACDGGNAMGCGNIGILYARGWGVSKDDRRAGEMYDKACSAGENLHCGNLGILYQEGRGVKKDIARAISLLEKGCTTRKSDFCERLKQLSP